MKQFILDTRNDPVSKKLFKNTHLFMKNIIQFTFILALAIGAFSVTPQAFAFVTGGGGTGCGGCGDGGGEPSGGGGEPWVPPASCDAFTGSPTTLPNGGGNVTLSWATSNATNVSISQGVGSVAADGSRVVVVTTSKTFVLTAINAVGVAVTCNVPITVQPPVVNAPICDSFTGSPTTLPHGGGNVTLNWATTNATGVSINNGVGTVAVDGSTVVNVTASKTFVLTATNVAGASVTCNVPVTVQPPVVNAPICDSFTGSPTSLPVGGGTVNLAWATTNATNVSIDQGVGAVAVDGSTSVANVTSNRTFTLTATNVAGAQVTCTVPVTVATNSVSPSCDFFNADKTVVDRGESFTLSWGTTNADSVSINNGVGTVAADGSHSTSIQSDTTYTLTATKGSNSVSCSRPVTIRTSSGGGGSSSPQCTLKISDKKVRKGEEVKLTWTSTRATDVVIKDSFGKTLLDTDDMSSSEKKDFLDGDMKVRPTKDTTYTIEVSKGSKDRTCKVSVDVDSDITVLEVRNQPLVAGIALTQVPYTGFDAGPTLTFIFYTMLALWALFIAYSLVLKKKVS